MISKKHVLSKSALATMISGICATGAISQETEEEMFKGLETVVVSAQRREETAQTVPISVNAYDPGQIEALRIVDFNSLAVTVPGFSISSVNKSRMNPSLRGGSSSLASAGAEQAVGLFIDDQYFGGVGDFEIDLFDVERIEVLRGPQGTLFGRNTTGGSINVVTKRPTDELEGKLEFTVGNYETLELRGVVSGPLTEKLSGLVAFASREREGTSFNSFTGNDIESTNRSSLRGKLFYEASDTLNITAALGYSRADETDIARDAVFLDVPITNTALIDIGYTPDDDPRTVQNFSDGGYGSTQFTANLRFEKDLENAQLLSITTYRDFSSEQELSSLVGVPVPITGTGEPREVEAYSQEFRYVSSYDGPLNWVGGLFYFYSDEERNIDALTTWDAGTAAGVFQSIAFCPDQLDSDSEFFIITPACVTNYPDLFNSNEFFVGEKNVTTSYSVYADGTFDITDKLTILGGVRYTRDEKELDANIGGEPDFFWNPPTSNVIDPETGVFTVGQVVSAEDAWSEFTYRAGLQYDMMDDVMLYATYATGFRSGAFDAAQSDPNAVGQALAPETVKSMELGFKSRWLDDRVQFNVAAFQATYEDLQFFVTAGNQTFPSNAGEAEVQGVEIDLTAALTENLVVSLQYVYQDGTSRDIPEATEIAEGTPPAGTIPNSYVVGLNYERPLANGDAFFFNADVTYKERYNLEFEDAPQFYSETDSLVNARLGYRLDNGWELSAWGQNLTDEDIVISGQNFWFAFYDAFTAFVTNPEVIGGTSQPRYGNPRTYGLTIRKEF